MYPHINCSYLWKQPFPLSNISFKFCFFFFTQSAMFIILSCTVFFFALCLYGSTGLPAFVLSRFKFLTLAASGYIYSMEKCTIPFSFLCKYRMMIGLSWAGRWWMSIGNTSTAYYLMGRYCARLFLASGQPCNYMSHHFQPGVSNLFVGRSRTRTLCK